MRIQQIQGLRALAAILVIAFHAKFISGGFIGVDIFYVISGYLITGLLLQESFIKGTIKLAAFYKRRIKRLLPSSALVLVTTAIFSWAFLPSNTRATLGKDFIAASLYVSNYLFAWWHNDYQNLNATPSPVLHYWSLAVEEQFYLLWPLFILFISRKSRRFQFLTITSVTIISFLFSLFQTNTSPIWAFYSLPSRAWELGIGALLLFIPAKKLPLRSIAAIAFVALLLSALVDNENTKFPGTAALLPVLSTAILILSISQWPKAMNMISNNRVSQWLGAISYPLYLWHWPLLVLPSTLLARPITLIERVLCIAMTLALAQLTHQFLEEPLRVRSMSGRVIYTGALATTTVCVLIGSLILSTTSTAITITGKSPLVLNLKTVTAEPKIYADKCHLSFGETKGPSCFYGDLTSSKTIVLFGDSHAAQWFPALEEIATSSHLRILSLTKSSCPAIEVLLPDRGGFRMKQCAAWRTYALSRIKKVNAFAVITSNYSYYDPPANIKNRSSWWSAGEISLLKNLQPLSSRLVLISDTPHPLRDIPSCLETQRASSCDNSLRSPLDRGQGFKVIDPTSWLCSQLCPAVVSQTVAYRDASHISVQMSRLLAGDLAKSLKAKAIL